MHDIEEFILTRRLLHLSHLLINRRHKDLEHYALTFSQAEALIFFDKRKGARASDLKEHFNISHQAARNIVERLCAKHYVYAEKSEKDARARNIYLTKDGTSVCEELKQLGIIDGSRLLNGIRKEDTARMLELLKQMTENIT